jgi:hypothetical protein
VGTLANPDWLVTMRMGGGDWPITELCLCAKRTASDLTGIRPTADGLVEILGWSSVGAFVDWWCDAHANNLEETAQNFLPPSCTLEAFVMNLQAIDAYRRALLGSLLAHEPADPLLMTAEQFNQHCLSGIRSHDVRWLAPAFVSLVPGLGEYKLGGTPESARAPFDRALLRTPSIRIPARNASDLASLDKPWGWSLRAPGCWPPDWRHVCRHRKGQGPSRGALSRPPVSPIIW